MTNEMKVVIFPDGSYKWILTAFLPFYKVANKFSNFKSLEEEVST